MTEPIELKPCPFCGGKAEINSFFVDAKRTKLHRVICPNIDCWIEGRAYLSPEAAVTWWNTRHELTPNTNALDEINTTLQETVTALNSTEYVLTNDDDGHWYVVNAKDVDAFHDQLSYEDPEFDGLDVDEVGGAPSLVKFKLYRIE